MEDQSKSHPVPGLSTGLVVLLVTFSVKGTASVTCVCVSQKPNVVAIDKAVLNVHPEFRDRAIIADTLYLNVVYNLVTYIEKVDPKILGKRMKKKRKRK